MSILRRLPLYRLLLLSAVVLAVGIGATAIALALGSASKPPQKPLAQALHDALTGPSVEGVSANVTLTNHLLEGASLASDSGQGGEIASSPLLAGASGRLWIAKDGRVRLELQAEKGDTQVLYDGSTLTVYDAASNTLYHYKPPAQAGSSSPPPTATHSHEAPSVTKIEEALAHIDKHATLSGATPDNVAGAPAYTVRVSPKQSGSLLGGAELSFDAANGAPLRAAIYSTTSSSPVIELAATEVSFGAVADSVFSFTPPTNAKVEEIAAPTGGKDAGSGAGDQSTKPTLTTHGEGPATTAVLESKLPADKQGSSSTLEGLPKVTINGSSASELRTALGTVLTFERAGVRYVLAGSNTPAAIEAVARGL